MLVKKNEAAIVERKQSFGWRIYVTNQPKDSLSLQQAVLVYRKEYKIERRIRNLKEEVTALLLLYLRKDHRIEALINLLVLVLKVTAAVEFDIARTLKDKAEELEGLYAGNPKIISSKNVFYNNYYNFSSILLQQVNTILTVAVFYHSK